MPGPLLSPVGSCGRVTIAFRRLHTHAMSVCVYTHNRPATPHIAGSPCSVCNISAARNAHHTCELAKFLLLQKGGLAPLYLSIADTVRQIQSLGLEGCAVSCVYRLPSSALHLTQKISWKYLPLKALTQDHLTIIST